MNGTEPDTTDQLHDGKIVAIQLLRTLAAGWVALAHVAWGYANWVKPGLGIGRTHPFVSEVAVALFFVVSGYVMVVTSKSLFGTKGGPLTFWKRRLIRIMPPYWLATALMVIVQLVVLGVLVEPQRLVASLALFPFWPDNGSLKTAPFLWPGWTLFYEMAFYAHFGLFLALGRGRALIAVSLALIGLAIAGVFVPADNAFVFTLTRSIVLVFIVGIALAAWREAGGAAPAVLRWIAGLASLPVLLALIANEQALGISEVRSFYCGIPAALVAFALLGGPIRLPAPRFFTEFGNMSYALYILHVPLAWGWAWFYRRLPFFTPGPWDYLVTALAVVLIVSWLFYRHVERPMTRALNRWATTPHEARKTTEAIN